MDGNNLFKASVNLPEEKDKLIKADSGNKIKSAIILSNRAGTEEIGHGAK